jgi:hypothetical protein
MKEMEIKVIERLFNVNKNNFDEISNGDRKYGIDPATLVAIITLLAQIMPYVIEWLKKSPWFAKIRLRSFIKQQMSNGYNTGPFSIKEISDTIYDVYKDNKNLEYEYVGS